LWKTPRNTYKLRRKRERRKRREKGERKRGGDGEGRGREKEKEKKNTLTKLEFRSFEANVGEKVDQCFGYAAFVIK
jgi:hypothetical protein